MTRTERQSIEVRAGQDRNFFYVGYSLNPGNRVLAQSVVNKKHYVPSPKVPYENEDGSVTLQFLKANLGFDKQERYRNFSDFVHETVIPQLTEAARVEVIAPDEISEVELRAGKMSLFGSGVEVVSVEKAAS